ncbi:MAG TPA: hypothetical protein VGB97_03810 [Candidatus Paceibacterota bacterium]|jgi:hypothetical protein
MLETAGASKVPPFENRIETFLPKGAVAKSLSEVPDLISKGSQVVFFADADSTAAFNQITPDALGALQRIAVFRRGDILSEFKILLDRIPAGAEEIKEAILHDIQKVVETFPEKKLEGIAFTTQFASDTGLEAGPWHTDDLGPRIRVLKTYTSQPTEYTTNMSPDPKTIISPPTGSFSFLTREVIHRRPALPPTTMRLTLLVEVQQGPSPS